MPKSEVQPIRPGRVSPGPLAESKARRLPSDWSALPGWPAIWFRVYCWRFTYCVDYVGTPADLIAAGCATQTMVEPGRRGRKRLTAAGYRFNRSTFTEGRIRIGHFLAPADHAERLPGLLRTWRSALMAALDLTEAQRDAFEAEGDVTAESVGADPA